MFRRGENVLVPTSEGTIYDLRNVDRYGNPDMMADFAEEYLRQFRTLMPANRLPSYLIELMPSLLLLFVAAELAIKAYWIRSGKELKRVHTLRDLYDELGPGHKGEIELRFASSATASRLKVLGIDAPKVEDLLESYTGAQDGRNVYINSRYFAEPADIPKDVLYPIFLPDVVRTLIDTYWHFAGSERLRRLGADLLEGVKDPVDDNYGEWGLIPSSLGLVVVSAPYKAGKDAKGENLKVYKAFKASHPTGLTADWMYGGNTLLFYRDGRREFSIASRS